MEQNERLLKFQTRPFEKLSTKWDDDITTALRKAGYELTITRGTSMYRFLPLSASALVLVFTHCQYVGEVAASSGASKAKPLYVLLSS
jgi:hypothetical protein